jgi:hypothetical protein
VVVDAARRGAASDEHRRHRLAPMGVLTSGQQRTTSFLALMPPVALADHVATSITVLLSDDVVNVDRAVPTGHSSQVIAGDDSAVAVEAR